MKYKIFSILFLGVAASGYSQGLLGILPKTAGEQETKPISFTVTAQAGYDSNLNTTPSNEVDSPFVGGSVGLDYQYVTERTVLSLGVNAGANYYFDQVEPNDKTLYNGRLAATLTQAVTDRLSIDNKAYFGYESEPNYIFGSSLNRRSDEYLFAYDDFSVNYIWTDRLSTSTSLSVQMIDYDESGASTTEDRFVYGARQLVRYALTDPTALRAEYRFENTDYDNGNDANRHYALVGLDHAINENTMFLAMVGAEFYDSDLAEGTKPYAELGITRVLSEGLSVRWANRLGYEDVGLGATGYNSNYTFRTNLDVDYQLSEKLAGHVGASYLYTDYEGDPGDTQTLAEGRVGLSYALSAALNLFLNYSYTTLSSDNAANEFDRHRVTVGASMSF